MTMTAPSQPASAWQRAMDEIPPDASAWGDPRVAVHVLDIMACSGDLVALPGAASGPRLTVLPGATITSSNLLEIPTENGVVVCQPGSLRLERVSSAPEWSFLWLDLEALPVSAFLRDPGPGQVERLCEIAPGVHLPGKHWDSHRLPNGDPLPDYSRLLWRCTGGRLLFVHRGIRAEALRAADSTGMARLLAERGSLSRNGWEVS